MSPAKPTRLLSAAAWPTSEWEVSFSAEGYHTTPHNTFVLPPIPRAFKIFY